MRRLLEVRSDAYHDSVTLLSVSQQVATGERVRAALVAMATELNLDMAEGMGFERADAGPGDLLVAIAADDEEALAAAREAVDRALEGAASSGRAEATQALPPRTLGAAARRAPFDLALVSVPGEHAAPEAFDALRAGASVMVFSDNVPVGQEIALKAEARRRGLLVMGPDCGTAIVGGVGLGFANAVASGPVGVVAASGTGAQQLTCLLDDAGVGVSHVLGVGGRDLSSEVGGASALQALEALDADEATEVIVLLSKPPDKAVAERLRGAAADCATTVVLGFVGRGERDLTEVADAVLEAVGAGAHKPRSWLAADQPAADQPAAALPAAERPPADQPSAERPSAERPAAERLIGLYAGGTLCDEAMAIAAERLGPIGSNIPLEPDWAIAPDRLHEPGGAAHWMIDFGADELTRGRPHPMIDHTLRAERLAAEAAEGPASVALFDVVLGHGAHPDPSAELGPAIADARAAAASAGSSLAVVVSLIGSAGDPQDRDRQAEALAAAGASVHLSNAAAAREAVGLVAR